MARPSVIGLVAALVATLLLAGMGPVSAAHKPHYKSSVDILAPDGWEAHFVWLRDPFFAFTGQVYWEFTAQGGAVDALFLTWWEFRSFRDGQPFQPLPESLLGMADGAEGTSGLSTDFPYVLVFRNPQAGPVTVDWEIFAEIDWRRLGESMPGPSHNLTFQEASPLLAQDASWGTALTEPGFYLYHCHPHADMTALIEVIPAAQPGAPLDLAIRDYGFHPEIVQVPAGTPLQWTNHDGAQHSVQIDLLAEGIPTEPAASNPWTLPLPWVLLFVVVAAVGGVVAFALLTRRREEKA